MSVNKSLSKARSFFQTSRYLDTSSIELREYQVLSAWRSLNQNTLIVLPTGLGKTIIAILHVAGVLEMMADPALIVMVAPTRALLVQHQISFRKRLPPVADRVLIVDGSISPRKREILYDELAHEPAVLLMTPQTLANDLKKDRFPATMIGDLIFDEAHHAREQHPYVQIFNGIRERGGNPRVLAMTASPGHDVKTIEELCNTLDINPSDSIFRSRDDSDVKPYVHNIHVERIGVRIPEVYKGVLNLLMTALSEHVSWLVTAGVLDGSIISDDKKWGKPIPRMFFIELMGKYQSDKSMGGAMRLKIISRLASCVKIHHGIELIESEGLVAFLSYQENLERDYKKKPSVASRRLLESYEFNKAVEMVRNIKADPSSHDAFHPKLRVLRNYLETFLNRNPGSKILVFAKYRSSIRAIIDYFGSDQLFNPLRFVGQATKSKKDKGISRKEQEEILNRFRSGDVNLLVATSVAEEGLDIAECDLVVFYEMVASVIKFIQRMGRTGRKRNGNVVMLYTEDTLDYFRMKALDSKMSKLKNVYYSVKNLGVEKFEVVASVPSRVKKRGRLDSFFGEPPVLPGIGTGRGSQSPPVAPVMRDHLSIRDLKRWQGEDHIALNRDLFLFEKVKNQLERKRIPVIPVDGRLPGVMIANTLGIEILAIDDAFSRCKSNQIFDTFKTLSAEYRHPFVIAFGEVDVQNEGMKHVLNWLKRIGNFFNVNVLQVSSVMVLAIIIDDFRKNIRDVGRIRIDGEATGVLT
ncbi:MAG: helicase-related protein [Promethearchaeota archaeon]